MNSRDFIYWLQGFFEISDAKTLTEDQVAMIRRHLNTVFVHEIDPSFGDEKHQAALNQAHSPDAKNAVSKDKEYASEDKKYKLPDPVEIKKAIDDATNKHKTWHPTSPHNPSRIYRC